MSIIKSFILKAISSAGCTLYKNTLIPYDAGSMTAGMERMKNLHIHPSTIIDIGAAQGTWTQKALHYWPHANYELIEPLAEQATILDQLKIRYPNINYHLAVAGASAGETFLNVSPDLDGSGVYGDSNENARKVPVVTIDQITAGGTGDILVKLDTHGYELPILQGATEALKRTSLLIIEVYGFAISPTCLVFHELSAYLDNLGFRLIDLVDIVRRPTDNAFWQADAFYARKDNPVFDKNSYA